MAFENTIRQNIDPGLVEKTKGNNFRACIHPLPAKGIRHIVIAVEPVLGQFGKDLFYRLPLLNEFFIEKLNQHELDLSSKKGNSIKLIIQLFITLRR
ncbi:MAG TPA: hypothetical protein VJ111_07775 [Chitinophagaceae bacterium]|nr:hypothetical protein [Chitinophagaceae bacterium]